MKILFAAGGTGGHITPAIIVAQVFKKRGYEVAFIARGSELERKMISKAGFPLLLQESSGFVGRSKLYQLRYLLSLPYRLHLSRSLLKKEKVSAVIGFGGYPAVLPSIAAWSLGLPLALSELNVKVGLANKMLALLAELIFASPETKGFPRYLESRIKRVANPIRGEFFNVAEPRCSAGVKPEHLLIMGGSQGAASLNSSILEMLPQLKAAGLKITHQAGAQDLERVKAAYLAEGLEAEVVPFIEDVPQALSQAEIVISRAGAMTVAEVSAASRLAVYLPLAISRAHQQENVQPLLERQAAIMLLAEESKAGKLWQTLNDLLAEPERIVEMGRRARAWAREHGENSAELITEETIKMLRS